MSTTSGTPELEAVGAQELPPTYPANGATSSVPVVGVTVLLVIVTLYIGQDIFIPLALAALLTFTLSPIMLWLRRHGIHRGVSVALTVGVTLAAILGLFYFVTLRAMKLFSNLSSYEETLSRKLAALGSAGKSDGWLKDLFGTLQGLGDELSTQMGNQEVPGAIPVVIAEPASGPLATGWLWVEPLGQPIATAAIVFVFLILFLTKREDLRDRFVKLVSAGDLRTSTAAMDEATRRVSRYLLMQLLVNTSYGVILGGLLLLTGVPGALLWGVLAGILRFIPIVGTYIAVLFPLALAFAVDPGWQMFALVAVLFVCLDLFYDYVVDPKLFGSSTGLSTPAIIVAAIFWTTLWGLPGLILSVPLSACIIVLGRHVPQLRFFDTVLGSEPALSQDERLYQRLLASNREEAIELGEKAVEQTSLTAFFDDVAVGTLRLAERDRALGMSEVRIRRLVAEGIREVALDAANYSAARATRASGERPREEANPLRSVGIPVLIIGARSELDRAAAEMVGLALRGRGIGAQVLPPIMVRQHGLAQIDLRGVEVVCLCYLDEDPNSSIRYVVRRLKERSPAVRLVACLLNARSAPEGDAALARDLGIDAIVSTVERSALLIDSWVARHPSDPMQAPGMPANELDRLRALHRLGLTTSSGRYFDEVAQRVSQAFQAPIALVTVVDEEHQHWPGAEGLPPELNACRLGDRETSICGHVVANNDVLVIEDTAADPRFANNPFLLEHGIRFYAGAPLRTLDGFTIGSLCVIDYKPRTFSATEKKKLSKIANSLMSKVEMNCYGFDIFGDGRKSVAPDSSSQEAPGVTRPQPAM